MLCRLLTHMGLLRWQQDQHHHQQVFVCIARLMLHALGILRGQVPLRLSDFCAASAMCQNLAAAVAAAAAALWHVKLPFFTFYV